MDNWFHFPELWTNKPYEYWIMVFLFLRVNWSLQCSTCAVCFISLENGPKDSLEQRKRAYCSCVWDWKHQTMENKEGVVCHLPGDFYRNCDLPCCLFLFHFFSVRRKKNGKTILLLFWFNFNLPFCLGNKPNNKRLYETADYVFSSSFLLHLHFKCSSFLFKFAYCIIIIQLLLDQRLKNKWNG